MSPVALAWEQFRFERKLFWRNPSAAFFNFVLPLLLLLLIATAFAAPTRSSTCSSPGIAGMSVMATTFTALAFNLTCLREQGILKRVRGTPMPAASYLGGMIGSAVLNAFVQVALVVAIGNLVYGVDWPHDWLLLVLLHAARGRLLRAARDRLRARDPELRRGPRLRERGVPAADLHLRRLLLGRRRCPEALEGDRRGAAAQAPDRRAVRRRSSAAGDAAAAAPWSAPGRWRVSCWRCASSAGS